MTGIKQGVSLLGLSPQIVLAFVIASQILPKYGQQAIITSGADGKHKRASVHYKGDAIDLRIWDLDDTDSAIKELKESLGENYDVVLESDHIHVEYDPKKGVNL